MQEAFHLALIFLQCFVLANTEFVLVIQDYFNFFYGCTDLKIKDHSFPFSNPSNWLLLQRSFCKIRVTA